MEKIYGQLYVLPARRDFICLKTFAYLQIKAFHCGYSCDTITILIYYSIANITLALVCIWSVVYISPLRHNLKFRGARNAVLLWNAYKIL